MSRGYVQWQISTSLQELVRSPDLEFDHWSISEVLTSVISPGDLERLVRQLRSGRRTDADTEWSTLPENTSDIWPDTFRVSEAAAPTASSAAGDGESPSSESGVATETASRTGTNAGGEADDFPAVAAAADTTLSEGEKGCTLPAVDARSVSPVDADGKSCAHYRCTVPARTQLNTIPASCDASFCIRSAYLRGIETLRTWIALRPELAQRLGPMKEISIVDTPLDDNGMESDIYKVGCYVWLPLRCEMPPYPDGTLRDNKGTPTLNGRPYTQAWHSASMYSLVSTVVRGLQPGPDPGKGGLTGVFVYKNPMTAQTARSSSGYCTYEALCDCGHNIYFGPRYAIDVREDYLVQQRIRYSAGEKQWALPVGSFHLRGIIIHIMTPDDIHALTPAHSARTLWFRCSRWLPQYEINIS